MTRLTLSLQVTNTPHSPHLSPHSQNYRVQTMALDLSAIVGIVLMSVGGLMVAWGLVLCYTTKGEYYNADEVQAMVAAEMLEEKRKKKEEEEMFDDIGEISTGKKKRRGPLIAD